MSTYARGRPRISIAFCCLVLLLGVLAVLPGCGCGDDSPNAAATADGGPDPCAPPAVNSVGAVSFGDAVRFLYDGACPRQTGVDTAVFDHLRVSVVRGRVVGEDGAPLSGVRVSVPRETRYGETHTGADGGFDLVVNGGSRTRLRFELDGHLSAQRSADAKTNRFLVLDEIALVQKSPTATALYFGDGAGWQVAVGDLSKDESAERRARLLVPPGTKASAVKPDGTRVPLATGTLRMTEYTRGAHGPAAMPSELPPSSGYTYASSFLFDEAGADAHIEFESPVVAYLDNFLGMKAGASVPSGALDEGADGWKAEPSGRVVKLVSGADPSLDANGDDIPDSPAELAALGVTAEELAAISGQAPSGSYFRVTMRHFSGFDFNWAFGAPADSEFPPSAPGSTIPDLPCITDNGSYFECERLTLGEDIPLVGTGIGLHYNSDRVAGYHGNTTFTVPVTEAVVPPSAKRAEVEVTVLGVTETKTYAIAPNLKHTFTWNGLDAYGLGRREVHTFTGGLDRDEVRSYQAPDGTVTPWTLRRDGTANVSLPDGTVIDITRDADPRLGTVVPYAAKHVVSFPSGLSRSVTQVWSAKLDANGALTELKSDRNSPDGRSSTVYDGTMRIVTTTSPEGRVVKVTLDAEGRLARAEYPGRMPITFTYDDRGRVAAVDEGGRTTRSSYDPQSGSLLKVENPLGQATSVERDGALRTTAFVHADGARSLLAWSPMDDLVGVTPPGKGQHVMDFGKDGNEVRYTPPGGAPLAFSYDLDRALASVTNEDGSASSLGYDTAGRVTSVTYPGGPLGVAYDPKTGQLRTLTTPGSSLAIDYDGLLVRGVTATGPASGTVTFTYDGMLRRGSEQVSTSTIKYGYDHDGLLTQAGSMAVGRESASGLIAGIDLVNAAQRFTHTPFGELATYRSQGAGGNVLDVALTYDVLSRIVDRVENGAAWHYDYDVRGRLTRVRKNGADVTTYAYDANGNRADGGAVIDAQDRVLSMNGATYTYSAAGERLTRTTGAGQTLYTYDGRGHLQSVTAPGGVRADYDLDAYGRRITKRRNGTVQNRFLYRNGLQPTAEVDAGGALISRYIYARGELGPDALERAGVTYLLLKDERGSIRYVIDATSGAVLHALTYDAFGRVLSDTSPAFQPFGFAGGIYDADTGLVHFGARDYDPETGSFTRKDPSRFGGGENLYAYAGGDPINFVDPDGESVVGAVVGGLEGAIINYAEEGATQALDPNSTGYDCDKIRSAAKVGAIVGAVSGATKARGKQCFAAGTEVATESGPKAIEAIAVGDRVLSSTEQGEVSYQPVTRVFQRSGAEEVALTFTDPHGVGAPIVTTPEHPFRVASGEWVVAGRLDIGDNVVTAEGGLATLSAALSLEKSGTVYNFEVAGTHTYFVGEAKLWVHNACEPPPIKPGVKAGPGESGRRYVPKAARNAADAENPRNQCVFCGADGKGTQYDHADPYSNGGSSEDPRNIQKACAWCNPSKGNGQYPQNPPPDFRGPWPPPWWP
jgi:RHS repeat-associated protein